MRFVKIVALTALLIPAVPLLASAANSVPVPRGVAIHGTAMTCQALLTTSILPNPQTKQLETKTGVGTDKLAIEIHGSVLRFMTQASVEAGMATAAEFQILRNDNEVLVAVNYQRGALGSNLNSLLVNKMNGLAVWTKSRPSFLVDEEPDTQAHYLRCQ